MVEIAIDFRSSCRRETDGSLRWGDDRSVRVNALPIVTAAAASPTSMCRCQTENDCALLDADAASPASGGEWPEEPWEAKVTDDLSGAGYHVARSEFGACDVGAPYLRRRVFILACANLPRLEVAWRAIPSEIEGVKRAANARGDWEPGKLAFVPVDDRTSGERESAGLKSWRKEWIEAVGDSNPPHMAEVIGRAIMLASDHGETSGKTEG